MTDDELYQAIQADATALALAKTGNDAGCAARLAEALPPAIAKTRVSEREIIGAFANPLDGLAFINGLKAAAQSNEIVALSLAYLKPEAGGIDVGNANVRAMLDSLVAAGAIEGAARDTVKALAESPQTIDFNQVSAAMLRDRPNGGIVG